MKTFVDLKLTSKLLCFVALLHTQRSIAQSQKFKNISRIDKIDSVVSHCGYSSVNSPGLSVMVIHNGKVLETKSYGLANLENKIANNSKTNFRIASVSKQFTAMAIMILKEQKKLTYESTVKDFFPAFPDYGKNITIRQLLNHTSGLKDYAESIPENQTSQIADNDVLKILESHKSGYFLPGEGYKYSNSGYILLALIVEKVSGQSFANFLQQNIFHPLGMNATVVKDKQHNLIPNRAYGYSKTGNEYVKTDQSLTSGTYGDGGIYSSVSDLFKWDQALYTTKLVSSETLKEAFTPGTYGENQHSDYGFGWSIDTVRGYRKISHEGATIGFRSYIMRLPEQKFSIIVLMNLNDGDPVKVANGVARLYFPDLAPKQPRIAQLNPNILHTYEAFYEARGGISYFKSSGQGLKWIGITSTPINLLPQNDSTFFYEDPDVNPEGNWRVVFQKNNQGVITGYQFQVSGKNDFSGKFVFDLLKPDDSASFKNRISVQSLKDILQAMLVAGEPLKKVAGITDGLRKDLANVPQQNLSNIQNISFIFNKNIGSADIERHGEKVETIELYKLKCPSDEKLLVVYFSNNGLVTDEDVVDEY